jgi:DNA-binding transcriptional LysR family regulator
MDWQQLRGFYQVAKLGSFTQAAAATFRTQSALSQQVKALEQALETPLLERLGKRRLRLTPAGERVFQFAESLWTKVEYLQEELNEIKGLQQGPLRLGAPFTTLYHLLPETLKSYLQQFPHVELTLLDRPQQSVLALVKSGDLDLGLTLESVVPPDLTALRWQPVETVLLAPRGHPLTRVKRVTVRQLAKYPLILPPRGPEAAGRKTLEDHFHQLGLDYHVILESSNVELSALYVEMGLGIAFATLAQGLSKLRRRNLAFLPLRQYYPPDHLAVVLRRDQVLASYKRAFINLLFGDTILPE